MPYSLFSSVGHPGELFIFENGYCANVVMHKAHCCSVTAMSVEAYMTFKIADLRKAFAECKAREWEHLSDNELVIVLAEIAKREPVGEAMKVKKTVDDLMKKIKEK